MKEFDEMKQALFQTFTNFGFVLEDEAIGERSAQAIWSDGSLKYRILWHKDKGCGYLQENRGDDWLNLNATCPPASHNAFEADFLGCGWNWQSMYFLHVKVRATFMFKQTYNQRMHVKLDSSLPALPLRSVAIKFT